MSVRSFVQDNYKKLKICARDDCRRLSSIATRVLPATRGVVWHAGDGVHTRFSNPCRIPPRVFSLRQPHSQRHVYPTVWRHASIILGFAKNGTTAWKFQVIQTIRVTLWLVDLQVPVQGFEGLSSVWQLKYKQNRRLNKCRSSFV